MFEPDHAAHTSETAHRDDRVQYLITADETSLAQVQSELALLPLCARGRVFIEVEDATDVFAIEVPMRMTVSWLPRSTRAGRPGTGQACTTGDALVRAVTAWTAEMLCDGPGSTRAILTGDYRGVARVHEHLVDEIRMPSEAITAPARFRLRAEH